MAMKKENIRWQSVISLVFFIGHERRTYKMAISNIFGVLYRQWEKNISDGNQSLLLCSLLAMREEYIRWQSVITFMFFIGNERRIYRMAISHIFDVIYWQWEKNISDGKQSYLWCSLLAMREKNTNRQWVISLLLFSGNERSKFLLDVHLIWEHWQASVPLNLLSSPASQMSVMEGGRAPPQPGGGGRGEGGSPCC